MLGPWHRQIDACDSFGQACNSMFSIRKEDSTKNWTEQLTHAKAGCVPFTLQVASALRAGSSSTRKAGALFNVCTCSSYVVFPNLMLPIAYWKVPLVQTWSGFGPVVIDHSGPRTQEVICSKAAAE